MDKKKLDKRRKTISKILLWMFWIVLITGILVIPWFGLSKGLPLLFKISRLMHLIFGIIMMVLTFMHIKLEKRWETLENTNLGKKPR